MVQRQKIILQCFKSLSGRKTQSESLRPIEELKYCMLSFQFHSLRSHWEEFVHHKLWEEVKVQPAPPPAQLLCPNHPVTGELFGKTGLVRQRVVGEHRVVSWGAGAVGVLTGGRVLLEGHRQVQVLLSEERSEVRLLWSHELLKIYKVFLHYHFHIFFSMYILCFDL